MRCSPWRARCRAERSTRTYRSAGADARPRREDAAAQRPRARAGVDHDELVGLPHRPPPRVEGAGDDGAEQRADLGRGEEVTVATGCATGRVEALVLVVQRGLDEGSERQGAPPRDVGEEQMLSGEGHKAADVAEAADQLRVEADGDDGNGADPDRGDERGRDVSELMSPSGAGRNHISCAMRA